VADAGLVLDAANAAVPTAGYLACVRRARRRGAVWPARRTAAFAGGIVVAAAVTAGPVDGRAGGSLVWHMAQQMALLLVVAPVLVAGRPAALLRAALGRDLAAPGPAAAWAAFVGIQWVIHVPAVLDASLRSSALHGAEEWALVAAGAAFFAQAAGRTAARMHPLLLALYLVSAMPTTDVIALWLMLDPRVAYADFSGPGALADQRAAGVVMFAAGNVLLVAGAWVAGRYLWRGEAAPARFRRSAARVHRHTMQHGEGA
jgi:putative copper resistance protein D